MELFCLWYADVEATQQAAEAAMAARAEEDALVGPSLPGGPRAPGGAAGSYGGFLLPGEGDRCGGGGGCWVAAWALALAGFTLTRLPQPNH